MKKCTACGSVLVEGYSLSVMMSYPVNVTEKDFRGKKEGSVSACICPNCGKIELYLKKKEKWYEEG